MSILPRSPADLAGMKVTVMGLGLHGGGLESARFFACRGAVVTVTDLRDEQVLAPSIEALEDFPIRYILGRHELEDFSGADLVVKNPAVKAGSPYLAAAKAVESDISIFLRYSASPIVAVTGSKGKSSTVSAIQHCFQASNVDSLLGGNITVSPLSFLNETGKDRPVVLELSSWQLADLRGKGVLKPRAAVITAIMPDHMNYYSSMEEYVADKRLIYADQGSGDYTICDLDSDWGRSFAAETQACVLYYSGRLHRKRGAWLEEGDLRGFARFSDDSGAPAEEILPAKLRVPGPHMRKNLLAASLALEVFGLSARTIADAMASFPGVEHRLEFFADSEGVLWYNDSAATIPQAVEAALSSFSVPVILIAGGTDKNIDFEPSAGAFAKAEAIVLLSGSGTDKLIPALEARGIRWQGPFGDLDAAIREAASLARPGFVVLFSPGCASFGMFLHEFDRGKKFKERTRVFLGLDKG
ncbi:MAG: UDP-N-acetylmuramoyl-L-alanine--D-glutamate ligase [Spirochaetes bacterium]|nr:UDP-N-acetylmuramoyl-L-alanine--D-glutamate ligase [Spirochaetota bacterium]